MFWEIFSILSYRINHVTSGEYLELTATIEMAYDDRWNCNICLSKFDRIQDEKQRQANLDKVLRTKGCVKGSPRHYSIDNIRMNRCLGNFTSESARHYIDLFIDYEKGILPYGPDMTTHPAKIFEVFNTIRAIRQRKNKEQEENQNAANKFKNRSK